MREDITLYETINRFVNQSLPAVILAMFGGAVQMLNCKERDKFSWRWFGIGILTAGFAGYIMSEVLSELNVSDGMRTVGIAMAGYSANDILKAFRNNLIGKVERYGG
jgi:hypothetical protein